MPQDNIFNNLGWYVIKDNNLLSYPINSTNNESHKSSIVRFTNDYKINIKDSTSFEMSLNLATKGYICFHSDPNSYLIAFVPNKIKNQNHLETLKNLVPMLQTFNKPTGLVCVHEDGSFDMYDDFNWQLPQEKTPLQMIKQMHSQH